MKEEYLIIIALQIFGIIFHVGQKVIELDKKFENDTFWEVMTMFWKQDRITMLLSLAILGLNLLVHYIMHKYTTIPTTLNNYILYAFGIALILGYAGQRLIYSWLGKAEKKLLEKGDNLIDK